jgi:hypothetical protein
LAFLARQVTKITGTSQESRKHFSLFPNKNLQKFSGDRNISPETFFSYSQFHKTTVEISIFRHALFPFGEKKKHCTIFYNQIFNKSSL